MGLLGAAIGAAAAANSGPVRRPVRTTTTTTEKQTFNERRASPQGGAAYSYCTQESLLLNILVVPS